MNKGKSDAVTPVQLFVTSKSDATGGNPSFMEQSLIRILRRILRLNLTMLTDKYSKNLVANRDWEWNTGLFDL